jgi:hypothetical protein
MINAFIVKDAPVTVTSKTVSEAIEIIIKINDTIEPSIKNELEVQTKYCKNGIKYTEELENVMTMDNNPVHFAYYLTLKIKNGKTNVLYKGFGKDWYINNIQPFVRTMCRDIASTNTSRDLQSNRKRLDSLQVVMRNVVEAKIKELGMADMIEVKDSQIGQILPSKAVIEETEKTAAQMQSILTQKAAKQAEDARKAAEVSRALADKAYRLEMGMTNQEYLKSVELSIIKSKDNVQFVYGVTPIYSVK